MSDEPEWLTVEELVALNRAIVVSTEEPHQIKSLGLVESSQAAPINRYLYAQVEDVVALAVTLCISVGRNHGFMQGNKRTAFVAMEEFLWRNGYKLLLPDDISMADLFVEVITHTVSDEAFLAVVDQHVVERTPADKAKCVVLGGAGTVTSPTIPSTEMPGFVDKPKD